MIKKSELLQAIKNLEEQVELLTNAHNKGVENHNIDRDRSEYVFRFLADKLGYEIKVKDVIKVEFGEKVVRQ